MHTHELQLKILIGVLVHGLGAGKWGGAAMEKGAVFEWTLLMLYIIVVGRICIA